MVVDFFPKINIPVVFVGWNYPGLSAEEMERRVVIISERAYSTTVNGIERIESHCIPGIGLVKVYFQEGTDIGASIAQINAVNGTILRILPPGITPPLIIQYDAATVPIVQMNFFSSSVSEGAMFDHALNFVRVKLFTIPGLTVPAPFGGSLPQVNVDLDPVAMQSKNVSPFDVVNALQTSNVLGPGWRRAHRQHRLQHHDQRQPAGRRSVSRHADQRSCAAYQWCCPMSRRSRPDTPSRPTSST
jgi:multidrug efflux pump subunit AcrB